MEKANTSTAYTVFEGAKILFRGSLTEVVLKVKKRLGKSDHNPCTIFSDATGKAIDFHFHGSEKDVQKRLEVFVSDAPLENSGPGRPKLGVISREVSLLPRHWEWLATQAGGASAVLRRLVDEAKKKSAEGNAVKQAQERAYKFLTVMAGDMPGYEEALRALYRKEEKKFTQQIGAWPEDVKAFVLELAAPVFMEE